MEMAPVLGGGACGVCGGGVVAVAPEVASGLGMERNMGWLG